MTIGREYFWDITKATAEEWQHLHQQLFANSAHDTSIGIIVVRMYYAVCCRGVKVLNNNQTGIINKHFAKVEQIMSLQAALLV